jgi:predicted alpha/beta-hydrolase family hydrolase
MMGPLVALVALWPGGGARVEEVRIPVGTGAVVADVHVPAGEGQAPVLVVAPGRGYDRNAPLCKAVCEEAASRGYLAVRFDWRFYSAKGDPSAGLVDEEADLAGVHAWASQHERADPKKTFVVGKSLGSLVAWRFAQKTESVFGSVVLTPIMPTFEEAETYYPGYQTLVKPTVFVVGDSDLDNAPLGEVYRLAAASTPALKLVVTGGDHTLSIGLVRGADDEANRRHRDEVAKRRERHVATIARLIVQWADIILNR